MPATTTAEKPAAKPRTRAAAKPAQAKPKYQVIDNQYVRQTEEGEIKIRLRFKTKLVRKIRDIDGADELDQFFMLLDGIGDARTLAVIDELDIVETTEIVSEFFREFAALQEAASLGESGSSST